MQKNIHSPTFASNCIRFGKLWYIKNREGSYIDPRTGLKVSLGDDFLIRARLSKFEEPEMRVDGLQKDNFLTRLYAFGEKKERDLSDILPFLDVLKNPVYKAEKTKTYCNIFAYQVAQLKGVYLPRIFWLNSINDRSDILVNPKKQPTCYELSANCLFDWLNNDMIPKRAHRLNSLTNLPNYDGIVVAVAKNANARRSGHISVIDVKGNSWEAGRVNREADPDWRKRWFNRPTYSHRGLFYLMV